MPDLLRKIKGYFNFGKAAFLQHVTEEGRLFVLLKNLDLLDKLNINFVDSKTEKLDRFGNYYISVKIPQIESLSDKDVLAEESIISQYHQNKRVNLIYDISTESITFTAYTSALLVTFHKVLQSYDIDPKRIYLICSNANAEKYYKQWAINNGFKDYMVTVLGYHFYLYEYYWETNNCDWLLANHEALINSGLQTVEQGRKREKYFLCLNLRPRKHRSAIVLHLLERGFLDKGLVTYFGDEFAEHASVDQVIDRLTFLENLPSKDRLIPFISELDAITPLTLDKDADNIKKDLWQRKPGKVDFLIPEAEELNEKGISTYFEIITETWLTDKTNSYITEKTIRAFLRLQFFIHIGSPYLLAYLKEIGFQTFSPHINESYDQENDPDKRLELIFEEVDRLCNMSTDEIHDLYCKLWPRILHNYNHFKQMMVHTAKSDITNNILKKINPRLISEEIYE